MFGNDTNEQLLKYAALVAEFGGKMNLVSDPNVQSVTSQHVDDCVRAYECLRGTIGAEELGRLPIVDIGSGAGFPGVVWAILNPSVKAYLVESREKRATFLRHVALKLSLKNVEVVCSRFEDLPREQLPERCLFTSRAVGYEKDLTAAMIIEVQSYGAVWAVMSGPHSIEKLVNSTRPLVEDGSGTAQRLAYKLNGGMGERYLFLVSSGR